MTAYTEELQARIPQDEYRAVIGQEFCELSYDFLCFVDIYKHLSKIIPKDKIVIDFGCYLAAQSYFFTEHKGYIGVDVVDMVRFSPANAVHYVMTIQDFLKTELPHLFAECGKRAFMAVCSYVPDFDATEQVRELFPNVFCYYPSS